MKVRQDAWSHEDDLLLAETVLRHIREGSTQLNAFEEVGDKLNRTAAACGFRWNAEVRKKYEQAMEIAKKQRKERKRALAQQSQQFKLPNVHGETHALTEFTNTTEHTQTYTTELEHTHTLHSSLDETTRQIETKVDTETQLNLDTVISYLQSVTHYGLNSQILHSENERLTRENKQLVAEKEQLERKLLRIKQENSIVQEDYQSLVQIMDRARRLVTFNNERTPNPEEFPQNHDSDFGQIAK